MIKRQHAKDNIIKKIIMEKYSRGWRGAPAKGVGRSRGARVQIPLSPLLFSGKVLFFFFAKKWKKVLAY